MAFLKLDYSKPGPGVSKDEPEKKAFFRFFEIYGAKFWDLIKMNMLYFITIIIQFAPLIIFLITLFSSKSLNAELSNMFTYLIMLLCSLPLALTGPFTCGYAFLLRNCVRREHYFMLSDYNDTVKSNFKQSTIVTLINTVIAVVLIFNVRFYLLTLKTNAAFVVPLALCLFALMMLTFMSYYMYIMMVTFKLTIKQLYGNAIRFAILGVWRNILVTVLLAAIIFAHVYFAYVSLFFIPFLSLSFMGLIIAFAVWPMLKKYMIDPLEADKPEPPADDGEEDDSKVCEDRGREH
jgi:uncharacterized membrane protein YesL